MLLHQLLQLLILPPEVQDVGLTGVAPGAGADSVQGAGGGVGLRIIQFARE